MNKIAALWRGDTGAAPKFQPAEVSALPWLKQYWRIGLRWKWIMLAVIAACLIGALIVTLLMTPRYTATATLEISRQPDRIVKVDGLEPETSLDDQEFYQTQYSLIRARTLAESIVTDLNLANDEHFLNIFGVKTKDGGLFAGQAPTTPARATLDRRKNIAADILLANFGVAPVRGSRLVVVSFTSPDPALSAKIVNAWTAHFIESNLARRFDATAYARKFLERRLEQVRGRLEESERLLVSYAQQQRIINVGVSEGADTATSRVERPLDVDDLVSLNNALASATADRMHVEARLHEIRGPVSTEALTNGAISSLRQKRAEIAAEYAKTVVRFTPEYPAAKELSSQLAVLDSSIAREESRVSESLRSSYKAASERESALRGQVDILKSRLLNLRSRSIQYNIYQRDVDTNRQLYDALLQRYKEIGVAGGVGTNNVAVVDPALVPERPSSPRLKINLGLALLIGCAAALALAFALEQIDETIKDPADATRALGLPLLGAAPATSGDPLEQLKNRKSELSEAYLAVQTNLNFSTDHGVPRSLALTSARAGEGKTTSCFALALTLVRTRRNVVLIDCDLRSPSVHKLMGLQNDRGVSNFLAGDDNIDGLLRESEEFGMAIMSAGPQPPNAAELLTGNRLSTLIERLSERFDHILIDGPPVLGLADAPLIASHVEALVCAVEAHGARASMIRTAINRLSGTHVNLLGIILTKFEAKKAHYGYGYEYGYGYGRKSDVD